MSIPVPTIDANGVSIPTLAEILSSLQVDYRGIYGADADLDEDTQDGQWLGILAQGISDAYQAFLNVYNQFSPATSVGVGLSSVVKINGIARGVATSSTADLTIVGRAGASIANGQVGDSVNKGTTWALPATVLIPIGGEIVVTATCTAPGSTPADAGTLTRILTPTDGWQTVTNVSAAAPGDPVETDTQLRARQTSSTSLPALTVTDGILGGILAIPGVTQAVAHENPTGSADSDGVPAHTLSMIVLGGDAQAIVNQLGARKTPGTGTYGNTSETYVDPYGAAYVLSFNVPTQKTVIATVTIKALAGYADSVGVEVQNAVSAYVSALGIGTDVLLTRLYVPAQLQGPFGVAAAASPTDTATFELTSILVAFSPGSPGSSDLVVGYRELAVMVPSNVTLVVT